MVVPSVAQQLAAIRHTIAKTIMPALAADADFEREQAGLVLASLDWAMDVVESEHRYEIVEHADYRALLASLLDAAPGGGPPDAHAALDAAATPPPDLPGLRDQTRALKNAADGTFAFLTDEGTDDAAPDGAHEATASRARALVTDVARRQTERELAWTRMTGFPRGARAVAEVLADQAGHGGESRG